MLYMPCSPSRHRLSTHSQRRPILNALILFLLVVFCFYITIFLRSAAHVFKLADARNREEQQFVEQAPFRETPKEDNYLLQKTSKQDYLSTNFTVSSANAVNKSEGSGGTTRISKKDGSFRSKTLAELGKESTSSLYPTSPNDKSEVNNSISTAPVWKFGDVVHVINTRFMQHQSNLTELGQARLNIFKVFCLPTLQQQTSQNFLWIIRTDPQLHQNLKNQMIRLLSPNKNFILLASNDNPETARGFRSSTVLRDVRNSSRLLHGDLDHVEMFHSASQSRALLETRLDADDGIVNYFVEYMRRAARVLLLPGRKWKVWCADTHLEWHHDPPQVGNNGAPSSVRSLSLHNQSSGFIIPQTVGICITPGLTWGMSHEVNSLEERSIGHHKLHRQINKCTTMNGTECVQRLQDVQYSAIRARTPTSAGMAGIFSHSLEMKKKWESKQNKLWKRMNNTMSILQEEARWLEYYILNNIEKIASENLKGQCTKGHSCKTDSKAKLILLATLP